MVNQKIYNFNSGEKMKNFLIIICAVLLLDGTSFGQLKKTNGYYRFYLSKNIDVNQINTSLTNLGNVDYFYPYKTTWKQINYRDFLTGKNLNEGNVIVYDQGLWILGKINGQRRASVSEWHTTFSPGPIINSQPAMLYNPADSMKYSIYKITKGDGSENSDYANWPVEFGAPTDKTGNPLIKGDQTLWTVFNTADSSTLKYFDWFKPNNEQNLLPIEIQQLAFARKGNKKDNEDIFSNTQFYEYTIINKGIVTIDSVSLGFWTDIDFDGAHLNPPAVDTSAQVGYCWWVGKDSDKQFVHRAPPAIGYTLIYGPSVPAPGETAVFKGKNIFDHKNLPLTAFHGIGDDWTFLPYDMAETVDGAWNMANGLQSDGTPNINPSNGKATKFQLAGDPITKTGWIYPQQFTGGGAGFVMFTGPFNLAANDTQWVMIALTPAMGNDQFESIKIMREKANLLRSLPYDTLAYGVTPYKINYIDTTNITDIVESEIVPGKLELSQNFPNPFNPETVIIFGIPEQAFVTLKIYDILGREIEALVNEEKSPGTYRVKFNSSGLASGIYIYRVSTGNQNQVKKMILLR